MTGKRPNDSPGTLDRSNILSVLKMSWPLRMLLYRDPGRKWLQSIASFKIEGQERVVEALEIHENHEGLDVPR